MIRRNELAFEVCKRGKDWTAVVVCDVCGDNINHGGNLHWSWGDMDDQKYNFALPLVIHSKCSAKDDLSFPYEGGKMIKMDLMEYISLLLLKYPPGPALSHINSIHENDS